MKTFNLVLLLGLVASCGTENRYADTLASGEEQQTKQGGNTSKIVAGTVAGAIIATCVVVGLKNRADVCVPFVKRITKTFIAGPAKDDLSKSLRRAVKNGEITEEEAKIVKKVGQALEKDAKVSIEGIGQDLLDSLPKENSR